MRSSLLDYAFSVLAFYKTAADLRVNRSLEEFLCICIKSSAGLKFMDYVTQVCYSMLVCCYRICTITIQVLLHNCSHCMMDVLLDFTAQDTTKR